MSGGLANAVAPVSLDAKELGVEERERWLAPSDSFESLVIVLVGDGGRPDKGR